jgi:hypothetical protein
MKLELEENGKNVAVLNSSVVPSRGDQIRLRFPKKGELPTGTVVFEVSNIIYFGNSGDGTRAFGSRFPTRIVLNGKVLQVVLEK